MFTRPLRQVTTRSSRLTNGRPSRLMCTRPSRLKILRARASRLHGPPGLSLRAGPYRQSTQIKDDETDPGLPAKTAIRGQPLDSKCNTLNPMGRTRMPANQGISHGNLDDEVSNLHEIPVATNQNKFLCELKLQTTRTLPGLSRGRQIF